MVIINCGFCGEPFEVYPSQIERGKRFCSRQCTHEAEADRIKITPLKTRILSKIVKCSKKACWEWIGAKHKGYPIIKKRKGPCITVHRALFQILNKVKLLPSQVVRHVCDNPGCCNWNHWVLGTQVDNLNDKMERNRQSKGENHGRSKLTEEIVRKIKRKLKRGVSGKQLALRYKVSQMTISDIKRGATWTHV